ncbi:O-antigen ligase family protein [Microbacterium sp. BR1]|uniref:O-antigen ligase family protein n=1 Tax=Microbacterium sp. BR1 TaxID=1070896 RepID=UPI001E481889|nr:O-antigen ligase family protein [Microbacterium sp. BR1]
MTNPAGLPRHPLLEWVWDALDSAAFARAFTLAVFGSIALSFAIQRTAGVTAYATIVAGLCAVGIAILVRRRHELVLMRLVPSTLVLFLVWLLATAVWSTEPPRTLVGWLVLAGPAFLAIVVAHVRDTLQTMRALGDTLRALLSLSLALEILSGILLDIPIRFLGIQGNIALGGPVQGIFGTRNMLGFVAVIALITFVIEWRTRSIPRGLAIFSLVLGGLLAILSASPTVFVLALAVALATGALALVRHAPAAQRRTLQIALLALLVFGGTIAYFFRNAIVALLNAGSDFATRAELWDTILIYVRFRPIQGWGWFGPWPTSEFPFASINIITNESHATALNAYFDVLLQSGWVGFLLFAGMCALAVVRSWLVASKRRSVLYAWTPLILVTLLVDSMFESFTLSGFGWLLLVVCVVRAGLSRSWRDGIRSAAPTNVPPALPQQPLDRAG